MKSIISDRLKIYNCDNLKLMATLPDGSIDVICIDPPYLYLKNQKLERVFDEPKFFLECKRLLTKNGFIVMFGRGTSFYRWNTLLYELGLIFKEEIVWDKSHSTSPVHTLNRTHETISIFAKGNGVVNKVKIPYLEQKADNLKSIIQDIKRIKSALNNEQSFNCLLNYLDTNERSDFEQKRASRYNTSIQTSAIGKQEISTMMAIKDGMKEKSVMKVLRDHYTSIHPTQKPVRLLERLLALVIPDKPRNEIVVADFFAGSMSCMEAVYNMGMQGIATEIEEEYFNAGKERIESLHPLQVDLFTCAI